MKGNCLTKRCTRTAIPLRSVAAGELCRQAAEMYLILITVAVPGASDALAGLKARNSMVLLSGSLRGTWLHVADMQPFSRLYFSRLYLILGLISHPEAGL